MKIIAGPCQHESLEQSEAIARECKRVCDKHEIDYVFKASYDKANRSSISGQRGVGMSETMHAFGMIKDALDIKTLTDVHTNHQIGTIMGDWSDCVDVLQIPAFLCRQTDLIVMACETDKIVNIKKGQFMAPWDMHGVLSKTENAKEVWITERGICHGYNNLVVDFNGMQYMLDSYNVPLVFDATHSVQRPSANGVSSGGNRDHVAGLTRAASALGVSHFFLEVHDNPDNAPSDGDNMLHLKDFERTIDDIMRYSYTR
jgi:2-dehydro-3-deoxyphosphooctonate aldolase (KDO 8-P synthase)